MAQEVKGLAATLHDGTQIAEGENQLSRVVLWPPHLANAHHHRTYTYVCVAGEVAS